MVSISGSKLWEGMKAAEPCVHGSVRIVPLVGPSSDDPTYRLFNAETAERVKVSEVDESGHVPNVTVDNGLDDRLLLILVGVQMFTTGLLGEMIILPRMERTTNYHIRQTIEPSMYDPA